MKRHTVHTRHPRYKVPNYERGRGGRKGIPQNGEIKQPSEVLEVWDNGGETADRYTVIMNSHEMYPNLYDALGLSSDPSSPQGFSQWTGAKRGTHLGKRVNFKNLPDNVQRHIIQRLSEE